MLGFQAYGLGMSPQFCYTERIWQARNAESNGQENQKRNGNHSPGCRGVTPIRENQMEKKREDEMETGIIVGYIGVILGLYRVWGG